MNSTARGVDRALLIARTLVAAALIARLGGVGSAWLPSPGWLGLGLVALHAATTAGIGHLRECGRLLRAHPFAVGMAVTVLLAFVVRWPGYVSDLGNAPLDIDEHRLAANVKHYFSTGELRHDTVEHYPGAVFWLFSAASFLGYVRSLTGGLDHAPSMLPVEFYVHAARTANLFVAAGIVVMTGLLGRRMGGPLVGVLSAVVLAIVPLSVETTVLVRNDPAMVLTVTAAVHAALVFHTTRRWSWAATAGVLAGLAIAIKYSSVFALVPALVATASAGEARVRIRNAGLVLAGCVLAVGITNHFVWTDVSNFLRQLSDQVAITGQGHWAATDNPAAFHVMILERLGPGLPLLILACGFAAYGLASRRVDAWIFLSFPLLYIWFMAQRPSQFPRWVYPLVPFVAVAGISAMMAIVRLTRTLAQSRPEPAMRVALQTVALLVLAAGLWHPLRAGVVSFSRRITPPTHASAVAWISQNIPPGSSLLIERSWLDLRGAPQDVRRVENLKAVLDKGAEGLAAYEWMVVPEIYFGHPTLRRLGFVRRFHADQGFGGSVGYDYEVYSVPKLPGASRH